MMDSSKQGWFISLQDICKLKVLLNIELFPLKALTQLPRSIRRHIFRILPLFDRLYYEQDYDDFQSDFLIDLEIEDIQCPDNQKLNGNSTNTMKKALIDCLFKLSKQALVEGCRVNLEEASHFLDCLSSEDQPFIQYVFDYMNRCCSCEVLSWSNDSHSSGCLGNESSTQKPFNNYLVIPSRFINGFLAVKKPTQSWERPSDFEIVIHNLQAFVSYCKLQLQSGGKRLSIDTISLLGSPLWGEYSSIKEKAIEKHKSSHPPEPFRQPMTCEQDHPGASSSTAQPHQLISSLPMSSAMPAPLLTSPPGMASVQPPTSTIILSSLPLGYTPLSETLTVTSSLSSTPVPEQSFPSIVQLQPFVYPLYNRSSHSVPIVDPTCYFFRDMLSSVEHLVIGTNEQFEPSCYDEEELSVDVPSFIMHNIVQSHLKSIHIHGICHTVTDTIDTVTAFLCGQDNGPAAGIMKNRYDQNGNEYSIKPSGKPCFIENLKITAESGDYDYVRQYMLECDSASISDNVKEIIKSQKSTLKSISLSSLGFTYNELETSNERLDSSSLGPEDMEIVNSEEYCSLLQTTLVDFVQFPQFESLNLGESPDRVCYPLVMAFLTTPASHEQKLSISLRPQKPVVKDWYKECTIPTNIPCESNLKFKFLDLNGEESQVIKHILSFPSLSLKSFRLSTRHLSARDTIPSTINIQSFTLLVEDEKFSDVKLDSFICGNPSLRTLTISQCGYNQFRSLLSIINKCLVRLISNQATLESIILDGVDLSHYLHLKPMVSHHQLQQAPQHMISYSDNVVQQKSSTSSVDFKGYNFTKWLNPTVTNIVTECKSAISPHKTMYDGNNNSPPTTSGSLLMSGGISVSHGLSMSQSIGSGITGTGFSPTAASSGLSLNYCATPLIGSNIGVTPPGGSSAGSFIQPHPSFSIHTPPTVSVGDGINTFISQLMDEINVPATVYEGNDLFMFFFLLQRLDAALTLTASNLYLDRKCENFQKNLVPLLEEAKVKIRKITLKNNYQCFKDVFNTVASTVSHI